jgi:hypothetical protein
MITPNFSLDFTTATLDPKVVVTRALNTATRINSLGFVETVNANLPRFDYDPVTLACKGLLIEENRTNIALQSANFNTGFWGLTNASLTTGITDPAGGTSAVTFTATGANGLIQQPQSGTAGAAYSASFWIKRKTGTGQVSLRCGDVTLIPITVTSSWVRYSVTAVTSTTTVRIAVLLAASGDAVDIAFAQLEAGAFATSYIPTTTTASTRNADVATITGTNFSDFWQAGKGGASVQAIPSTVSGIRPLVQYDDGTANEIIALRGNTTNPELYIVDGGAPQVQLDAGTIAANTAYSLTGWWQTNDCKARKDSGAVVTDNTATIPTVTQARLGSDGTNYLNGHLATVNYYDSFFGQSIYTRRKNKVIFSLL